MLFQVTMTRPGQKPPARKTPIRNAARATRDALTKFALAGTLKSRIGRAEERKKLIEQDIRFFPPWDPARTFYEELYQRQQERLEELRSKAGRKAGRIEEKAKTKDERARRYSIGAEKLWQDKERAKLAWLQAPRSTARESYERNKLHAIYKFLLAESRKTNLWIRESEIATDKAENLRRKARRFRTLAAGKPPRERK